MTWASSNKIVKPRWAVGASLAVACSLGCGKSDESKPATQTTPAQTSPTAPPIAKPTAFGRIVGTVTLTGAAPPMPLLNRSSDPVCAATATRAPYVRVGPSAGLADVLVRLPPGAAKADVPSSPLPIRQHQCMYEPYVAGIIAGQAIAISNGDKTLHNVQTWAGQVSVFNRAQPPGSQTLRQTFDVKAGEVLKFACNVHTWMLSYVVVTDHDLFTVTGTTGTFTLDRVPVGSYQLEAWHPHFAAQTTTVVVNKDVDTSVAFRFSAASYAAPR